MKIQKNKNIKTWKYTNIHVKIYKCQKFKRVCEESTYINENL